MGPHGVTLKQIRYFVAIAEAGSYRQAAQHLNISQPPLTHHMNNLERALGVALFNRAGGRARLTMTGSLFLVEAQRLLTRFETTISNVRAFGEGVAGNLRIGLTDDFINSGIFSRILRFDKENGDIRMETSLNISPILVEQLHSSVLDLALVNLPLRADTSEFGSLTLPASRMMVVLRRDNPWASLKAIKPQLLHEKPLIGMPQTSGAPFATQCERLLVAAGAYPNVVHETESPELQLQMVREGLGVAMVSENSIGQTRRDLLRIPIDHPLAKIDHAVLYRQHDVVPALDRLVAFLADAVHDCWKLS